MKKVACLMSGGVDSAVCALLLKDKFEVIGITAIMSPNNKEEIIKKSSSLAKLLNIEHYLIDITDIFSKEIIKYFSDSYIAGQTPSPCAMCNKKIKFGILLKEAEKFNTDFIATGHYAKIIKENDNLFHLYKADDDKKDQSYFLSLLTQEVLSKTLFPLAEFSKKHIKEIAVKNNFPINVNNESQDLCFVNSGEHYKIIEKFYDKSKYCGYIKDINGKILKKHDGFYLYTIGQRKGLGISSPYPLYVKDINPNTCDIIVSGKEDIFTDTVSISNVNWIIKPLENNDSLICKIRYNNKGEEAIITKISDDTLTLKFNSPVFSATKGQLATFYTNSNEVLGGGWII